MVATISPPSGSVRSASTRDLPALVTLLADVGLDSSPIDLTYRFGHLLVFELDAHIRAAAYVVIDPTSASAILELLVVDPSLIGHAIQNRLLGVASALSQAYGCRVLEVASVAPHATTAAPQLRAARGS